MTEQENQICNHLAHYVMFDLIEYTDTDIFIQSTMLELGELFFNKAIENVEYANDELLKVVIKTIQKNNAIDSITDYYLELCEIVGIKKLPKDSLLEVQQEYDKIFVQMYNSVLNKANTKISEINTQLLSTKTDIKSVESKQPSFSLIRDLATEENLLQELYRKCNELRTQKEMIVFSKQNISRCLNSFCKIEDPQNVDEAIHKLALDLSKNIVSNLSLTYSFYKDVLEIAEDHLDRPYALFFKVKLYTAIDELHKNWHCSSYSKTNEELVEELNLGKAKIPQIDDLNEQKKTNPQLYLNTLQKFTTEHDVINKLSQSIEESICLRERKELLLRSIELFQSKDFLMFSHVITVQIEGIFGDFLKDSTTFNRFTNMTMYINDVLKEKIQHLQDVQVDIYPEVVEYFMYYFNNIIRNRIAHGNYKSIFSTHISTEIFAHELLLDLSILVHMLSRKSETEKMYRFISGYKSYYKHLIKSNENPHFGAMFNDMIGDKILSGYDFIEKNRPIQVAYWLVNPYYERIYESTGNKSDLIELRSDFLSKEFWEYVVGELNSRIENNFGYHSIDREFLSVVNGLFKCNITPDVKILLGQANASLKKIEIMKKTVY